MKIKDYFYTGMLIMIILESFLIGYYFDKPQLNNELIIGFGGCVVGFISCMIGYNATKGVQE